VKCIILNGFKESFKMIHFFPSKKSLPIDGGEGGFKDGKREGNVVMNLLLKPIKDPARLQWHEVYPAPR
jgi:hypothetical protein